MIRVAICDEKQPSRKQLLMYCTDYFYARGIDVEIQEYTSGESMLLEDFPDVLFLGTETGQIDGLLVKEVLQKLKAETRVIFVSERKERIAEAFGKNVYGFLPETLGYALFTEKITEAVVDYYEQHRYIFCKCGKRYEKIFLTEVLYVEACGKYTKIYTVKRTGYLLCDKCMSDWIVDEESTEFLWCHRSYLVNLLYIHRIGAEGIELENGIYIPLSRRRRVECYQTYQHFLGRIKHYEKRNRTIYCNIKTEL